MMKGLPSALGVVAGLLALAGGLGAGGDTLAGWQLAARWTARAGFPLFLVTYLASSLARLWPLPLTRALLRDRRAWGLGFAACHGVHLGALIMVTRLNPEPRSAGSLIPGGAAYLFIAAMALTSSAAATRLLGGSWKRLHGAGIHVVWLVFTVAYARRTLVAESRAIGVLMTTLALLALATLLAASRSGSLRAAA